MSRTRSIEEKRQQLFDGVVARVSGSDKTIDAKQFVDEMLRTLPATPDLSPDDYLHFLNYLTDVIKTWGYDTPTNRESH